MGFPKAAILGETLTGRPAVKRITYVSRFARPLTGETVTALAEDSRRRNEMEGVTGVLLVTGGIFFQIIEGDDDVVDALFLRIEEDSRHCDVIRLATETDLTERAFPGWSMRVFDLDRSPDELTQPFRRIVSVLTDAFAVLQHYTPSPVAGFMRRGVNPLTVAPRHVARIILFSDMVGFSRHAAYLPVDELMGVVNVYLSLCASVVTSCGGQVSKFVGDCVMAIFPEDGADRALEAGLEILASLERIRDEAPLTSPLRVLHGGVGLASGEVVEGNVGSATRSDFTVLGAAVNRACALEAATHQHDRGLFMDDDVRRTAVRPWPWLSAGTMALKGETSPRHVWTLELPVTLRSRGGSDLEEWVASHLSSLPRLP